MMDIEIVIIEENMILGPIYFLFSKKIIFINNMK
jgi:hypothetical protein